MTNWSDDWVDTGGMACTEDAKAKAKETAINLIICSPPLIGRILPAKSALSGCHCPSKSRQEASELLSEWPQALATC